MKNMKRIFVPTQSAEDWFSPDRKWQCKPGHSAKALADCWEEAHGFPPEVKQLFADSGYPAFARLELLLAIPEYQVPLPGGETSPSCNDLFVIAKGDGGLIAITVEGKVSEPFGKTLDEWGIDTSPGRKERFAFLKQTIGITREIPGGIRYQLLHRTASAILEARRFEAPYAVMLVHSFSKENESLGDYQAFLSLYGTAASENQIIQVADLGDVRLFCGWVYGDLLTE